MECIVLPLSSPEATLERVGGKGANLAELARAGFAVPPGFLVTTDAYRAFVASNRIAAPLLALAKQATPDDPLALEATATEIGSLFAQGALPEEIAEQVRTAYRELSEAAPAGATGELAVAVRSSATAEDLPGLSFAGQQDTYLNVVGADALLQAVKQCWGSLWTARAIGYRARNRIAPEDVALAVVVQVMVPSEVSGVLFTANPLTGRRDEIVIDASFGLGEAIVSGQVEPDHYVVDPHTWRVVARKIGAKALAIMPRDGGGTLRTTPAAAQRQALPDAQIVELARLGLRAAAHFGAPQDLEWAWADGRLLLLQSRPITSLYPLPELPAQPTGPATPATGDSEPRVYFNFNSVQGVLDPITPLGRDVLRFLLDGILNMLSIPHSARDIAVAGGRLFVDITEAVRAPRGRRIFLAMLSNADPGARQTIMRLIDEGRIGQRREGQRGHMPSPRRLRAIGALLRRILGRALAAWQAPEYMRARACSDADRYLEHARRHVDAANTLPALLDRLEYDLSHAIERLFPMVMPVALTGLAMMGLVDRWLAAWLGLKSGAALGLMRGLPGNVTTEMDLRLWALAQSIRADAAACEALRTRPIEELASAYRRAELPPVAQRALEQFLRQYGMRAVAEIDIGRRRWRDDPTHVLQLIAGYLQQEDPELAPDRQFERGAAESERLGAEYVARARRTRWGALRAPLLGAAIRRIRLLSGLREAPKLYVIKALDVYRTALLDHGRDLAARGLLEQAEDIFFVPFVQLRLAAQGQALDLKGIVSAQRAEYERERTRRQMPRVLLSTGEAFYEGMSEAGTDDLVGDAVSPGVVEGRVRVVQDPRGVRLEPGEILVCPATDPGWTPLFLTAGGLVMELGGLITHGSVVAREYGIPAVVGVHDATVRLHTGQRVRVDGSHGRVTLLEEAAAT